MGRRGGSPGGDGCVGGGGREAEEALAAAVGERDARGAPSAPQQLLKWPEAPTPVYASASGTRLAGCAAGRSA